MVNARWNKKQTRYDTASEHYDRAYFDDQARHGLLRGQANAWKFEPYLKDGMEILDFGCGDGALLTVLGGKNGVEINPHAAEAARARGLTVHATIDEYPDNAFDAVISNHCIEHVEDPARQIREMRRVLKDDGILMIVVPCDQVDFPYREADRDFHLYSWSAANLGNLVKTCGFDVVEAIELKHRWPPKWPLIVQYGGWRAFHAASWLWARLGRKASQVRCIARATT